MDAFPTAQLAARERFEIREAVSAWNAALDAGSAEGVLALSEPGIVVRFGDIAYTGEEGVRQMVRRHGSSSTVARRTHTNHVQAWAAADRVRSRSFMLVVTLVRAAPATDDGAPAIGWLGYAADDLVATPRGWRFAAREFRPWEGDVLSRFGTASGGAS